MEISLRNTVNAEHVLTWLHRTCQQELKIDLIWSSAEQVLADLREIRLPAFVWRQLPGIPVHALERIVVEGDALPVLPMATLHVHEHPLRLSIDGPKRPPAPHTRRAALERTEQLYRMEEQQRPTPLKRHDVATHDDAMEIEVDEEKKNRRKHKRKRC
jgi:hypothetical protein